MDSSDERGPSLTRAQLTVLWIGALVGALPGILVGAFGTGLIFLWALPEGLEPLPVPLALAFLLAGHLVGGLAGLVTMTIPMAILPQARTTVARVSFGMGLVAAGWLASPFVVIVSREGLDLELALPFASLLGAALVGLRILWVTRASGIRQEA